MYAMSWHLNQLRQEDYKRKLADKDWEQSPCLEFPREGLEIEFSNRVFA